MVIFTDASGGSAGGTIDFSFSVQELGLIEGSFYRLLVGTQLITAVEAGSEYLTFTGVAVTDGIYRLVEGTGNIPPLLLTRFRFLINEK